MSLRGRRLLLMGLRGRFAVGGRPVDEVALREGVRFEIARGLELEVVEVRLPDEVLGIEADGLTATVLHGTCALRTRPLLEVVPGRPPDARAVFWHLSDAWRVRIGDAPVVELSAGDVLDVEGIEVRVIEVPVAEIGAATSPAGRFASPLRLVTKWDTVHLLRDGRAPLLLGGIPARLISELAAMGVPVDWGVLAGQIWTDIDDRDALRRRLDVALARMRRKLRDVGIRADLVRSNGAGQYELFLHPADTLERRD